MKSLGAYWRRAKTKYRENRALNRSDAPSDEWRRARRQRLTAEFLDNFIGYKEFLDEMYPLWESWETAQEAAEEYVYQLEALHPLNEHIEVAIYFLQHAKRRLREEAERNKALEETHEQRVKKIQAEEQLAFDSSPFIKFLEH